MSAESSSIPRIYNIVVWAGVVELYELVVGVRTDFIFPNGFFNAHTYILLILPPIVLPFAGAVSLKVFLVHGNTWPYTAVTVVVLR